jgi:hypothetical protein
MRLAYRSTMESFDLDEGENSDLTRHRLLAHREAIDPIEGCFRGLPPIRKVWSAAVLQAKHEDDKLVCANVSGLGGVAISWPEWNALHPCPILVTQPW